MNSLQKRWVTYVQKYKELDTGPILSSNIKCPIEYNYMLSISNNKASVRVSYLAVTMLIGDFHDDTIWLQVHVTESYRFYLPHAN